jgi:serine protease AprX
MTTNYRNWARWLCALGTIAVLMSSAVPALAAPPAGSSSTKIEPSLAKAIAKNPGAKYSVIVRAQPPRTAADRKLGLDEVTKQIRGPKNDEGKLKTRLPLVNGVAAQMTGSKILALSNHPGVKAIGPDVKVRTTNITDTTTTTLNDSTTSTLSEPTTTTTSTLSEPTTTTTSTLSEPTTTTTSTLSAPTTTTTSTLSGTTTTATSTTSTVASLKSLQTVVAKANNVWATTGNQGAGVTVAVLDSGIHPSPDLPTAVFGIDVVSGRTSLSDLGGHGTHVAGIIAGTGAMSAGDYQGVAPKVRVMEVRVTDDVGTATYSSIIKGIQWVVAHRKTHNIRVINMSLGATPRGSYKDDPLSAAVEMAWFSGVVVVTSAGNRGPGANTISVPANNPYVITVGANDHDYTASISDDVIPAWSSRGPTQYDNIDKPDVVAGGRRVVSLRVEGSFLDRTLFGRVMSKTYFRLSGTSMAAPVVAGQAALILAANPSLTPNQVKYIIRATAKPVPNANPYAQGVGQVDALAAVQMAAAGLSRDQIANRGVRPSNIFAQSIKSLMSGAPTVWRDKSYLGRVWVDGSWDDGSWDDGSWDNLAWESMPWHQLSWTASTWESLTGWNDGSWDDGSWDDGSWDDGSWDDGSWDDGSWDSRAVD